MKAVLQRVTRARVSVDGSVRGSCTKGFLILLGVAREDSERDADVLAAKIANLRVFEDAITFKIALMVVKYMKYMENADY